MAWDDLVGEGDQQVFDHFDGNGNPVDRYGNVIPGLMAEQPDFGQGNGTGYIDPRPPPTDEPPPTTTGGGDENLPINPGAGPATPPTGYTPPVYSGGDPFAPWGGHFTPPTAAPLPGVPQFTPPGWVQAPAFEYGDFTGPTMEEAANSPGYQFRLGQGSDRLQNWAAARGTLNDSGTAKALMDYGQEAASQEYSNVWKRDYDRYAMNRAGAVDKYNTNYRTQYQDPYTASYQAAKDQFAPLLSQYEMEAANRQHLNDTANSNAWNDYMLGWQDYEARRNQAVNFALQS